MIRDRKFLLLAGASAFLLLAALACGMAYISVTYRAPAGEEQPKVTDWMQAWGSIAGVFAGLIAGGAAAALLMHERNQARLARAEVAAERAEAELAAIRAVLIADPRLSVANWYLQRVVFTVANYGSTAIRRVFAVVKLHPERPEKLIGPINYIAPGSEHEFHYKPKKLAKMPQWENMDDTTQEEQAAALYAARTSIEITLYFYDSAGQGWRLPKDGQPEKWSKPFPSSFIVGA